MSGELLFYGVAVAWLVLALFVASMAGRQRKLAREIASVRAMMDGEAADRPPFNALK